MSSSPSQATISNPALASNAHGGVAEQFNHGAAESVHLNKNPLLVPCQLSISKKNPCPGWTTSVLTKPSPVPGPSVKSVVHIPIPVSGQKPQAKLEEEHRMGKPRSPQVTSGPNKAQS